MTTPHVTAAIALIAAILERDTDEIGLDDDFADDLDADSLNIVEIAAALESEFGLDLDPDHPPRTLRHALALLPEETP